MQTRTKVLVIAAAPIAAGAALVGVATLAISHPQRVAARPRPEEPVTLWRDPYPDTLAQALASAHQS